MPAPLLATASIFDKEDQIRKFEYLPIPNITADYHINHGGEVLLSAVSEMWENVVGLLRLRGLYKTYRSSAQGRPANGYLAVVRPESITNGETFTLNDGVNPALTFEFRKTGSPSPGNVAVNIAAAVTDTDVMNLTIQAIEAERIALNLNIKAVAAAVINGMPAANEIFLENTVPPTTLTAAENQNVVITDTVNDERFTHEGMHGALHRGATGRVNCPDPALLVDGETFTVPAAANTRIYEFDRDGAGVSGGHVSVAVNLSTTDVQVATQVVGAVNSQTGATGITAVSDPVKATGYITALHPSLLVDGDYFTLNDGTNPATTFEYDKSGNGVTAGRVPIVVNTATSMQEVRAATIAAINGVGGTLLITSSNPGQGERITLTADVAGVTANQTVISAVQSTRFLYAGMTGGTQSVKLTQSNVGAGYNGDITDTVATTAFSASGMAGGMDAGWDVTDGHCAFQGYDIFLSGIPRIAAVAGKENFMKVRVTESRYTLESDPEVIKVSLPGVTQTLSGPNQIRWQAKVVIEGHDTPAPQPATSPRVETRIVDAPLAQLDSVNGQTIVVTTEVPVRVRKFGVFVEPIDFSLVVLKTGCSEIVGVPPAGMTGQLTVHPITATHDAIVGIGPLNGRGVWGRGGTNMEGVKAEGGLNALASAVFDSRTYGSNAGFLAYGDTSTDAAGGIAWGANGGAGLIGLGDGVSVPATGGEGVVGRGTAGNAGVRGIGNTTGAGVRGEAAATAGSYGVAGIGLGANPGVYGEQAAGAPAGVPAIWGTTKGADQVGVKGSVDAGASVSSYGVLADAGAVNTGTGLRAIGGALAGWAIYASGGAGSSFPAIRAEGYIGIVANSYAGSNQDGANFTGDGSGNGLRAFGGAGNNTFGQGLGVYGQGGTSGGIGVRGDGRVDMPGVMGLAPSSDPTANVADFMNTGVTGVGGGNTGGGAGVLGLGYHIPGGGSYPGVKGIARTGNNFGVWGQGFGTAAGVYGVGNQTSGSAPGVQGLGGAPNGHGVRGYGTGTGAGVYGEGAGGTAPGVNGIATGNNGVGVLGDAGGAGGGLSNAYGVRGNAGSGVAAAGVFGYADSNQIGGYFYSSAGVALSAIAAGGSSEALLIGSFSTAVAVRVQADVPTLWLKNNVANQANAGAIAFGDGGGIAGPDFTLRDDDATDSLKLIRRTNSFGASENIIEFPRASRDVKWFNVTNNITDDRAIAAAAAPSWHLRGPSFRVVPEDVWGRVLEGCELFNRGFTVPSGPGAGHYGQAQVMPGCYLTATGNFVRFVDPVSINFIEASAPMDAAGAEAADLLSNSNLPRGGIVYAYLLWLPADEDSNGVSIPKVGLSTGSPDAQGRINSELDINHAYYLAGYRRNRTRYVGAYPVAAYPAYPTTISSLSQIYGAGRVVNMGNGIRRIWFDVPPVSGVAQFSSYPFPASFFTQFTVNAQPPTAKTCLWSITNDFVGHGFYRFGAHTLPFRDTGPQCASVWAGDSYLPTDDGGGANGDQVAHNTDLVELPRVTGITNLRFKTVISYQDATSHASKGGDISTAVVLKGMTENINDTENWSFDQGGMF